jgi:hypothetical protein
MSAPDRVETSMTHSEKVIPKAYGSIAHLPGSRQGRDDKGINPGQAKILLAEPRKGDTIIVEEKLDGSNVAVMRKGIELIPLIRAGYNASKSPREQHQIFCQWVRENEHRFRFLKSGERVCGEWLAQAHGTLYKLTHEPFVAFDIFNTSNERVLRHVFWDRIGESLPVPCLLHADAAGCSIERAMSRLKREFHGAVDPIEGAVWRAETPKGVDFLGKFVYNEKQDGKYFETSERPEPLWNWHPWKPKWWENE